MSASDSNPPREAPRLRERAQANGWAWVSLQALDWMALRGSAAIQRRMRMLERRRGLTGLHTKEANRAAWNSYDWSEGGEEWSMSDEWRRSLIDEVLLPNLPADADTLEIGPGAGRWTGALLEASRSVALADIAEQPLELCRERFGGDRLTCHLTDGCSVAGVDADSIDFVWSFDAFVHIAPEDQRSYLADLRRVMRDGSRAVIHHAGRGGTEGGWRSSMTAELFDAYLGETGFDLVTRIESWGPGGEHRVPISGDAISVFEPRP
jgi:SAM-dependent methyltransferase